MRAKAAIAKKPLRYERMDLRDLSAFSSSHFQTIVDKACLDAIFTDDSSDVLKDVSSVLSETRRVLAPGGRYLLLTLAQSHVLSFLLDFFRDGWIVNVHWIETSSPMSSFLFSFEKTSTPSAPSTWSVRFRRDVDRSSHPRAALLGSMISDKSVRQAVLDMQLAVYTMHRLSTFQSGVLFETSLYDSRSGNDAARYEIAVVDTTKAHDRHVNGSRCAVLLVPPDRYREWTFSEREGQQQLCDDSGFSRLIVVRLHPAHFSDADTKAIQDELSPLVHPLAPRVVRDANETVLFVGVKRGDAAERVFETTSTMSGRLVVEQLAQKRRLIFLNSPKHVQTEVYVTKTGVVDHDRLCFEIHRAMISTLAWFEDAAPTAALVIGLGGGVLPMFLRRHWPSSLRVDAVEIDPAVVKVAETSFGLVHDEDDKLTVHVADGVRFVRDASKTTYDVVFLDANASDASAAIAFPPAAFLELDFLRTLRERVRKDDGMVVMNMSCRSSSAYAQCVDRVRSVFADVRELSLTATSLNRLVVARNGTFDDRAPSLKTLRASCDRSWSTSLDEELASTFKCLYGEDVGEDVGEVARRRKKKRGKRKKKKKKKKGTR